MEIQGWQNEMSSLHCSPPELIGCSMLAAHNGGLL
jgi:hypothetical protein